MRLILVYESAASSDSTLLPCAPRLRNPVRPVRSHPVRDEHDACQVQLGLLRERSFQCLCRQPEFVLPVDCCGLQALARHTAEPIVANPFLASCSVGRALAAWRCPAFPEWKY